MRRTIPKYAAEHWPRINEVVEAFKTIAAKYDATPAQITIAWLLAQGSDIIPIPGSKQIKYIEENLGANDIKLKDEDIKELRKISEAANDDLREFPRFGAAMMKYTYAETLALSEWKGEA